MPGAGSSAVTLCV